MVTSCSSHNHPICSVAGSRILPLATQNQQAASKECPNNDLQKSPADITCFVPSNKKHFVYSKRKQLMRIDLSCRF